MDRYLDQARFGPVWMKRDEIARVVVDSLIHAAERLGQFDLYAYAAMPNHVHVLLEPNVDPSKLLRSVKTFSACEANRLLGRSGERFWQAESYDRWVRDNQQFERIRRYIEDNPVSAGLVSRPEDYRWSSAYSRK